MQAMLSCITVYDLSTALALVVCGPYPAVVMGTQHHVIGARPAGPARGAGYRARVRSIVRVLVIVRMPGRPYARVRTRTYTYIRTYTCDLRALDIARRGQYPGGWS